MIRWLRELLLPKPCPLCGAPTWTSGYSGIRYCGNDACAWDTTEESAAKYAVRRAAKERRGTT